MAAVPGEKQSLLYKNKHLPSVVLPVSHLQFLLLATPRDKTQAASAQQLFPSKGPCESRAMWGGLLWLMQTDRPCKGMAAPGGPSPPVVSREPVESSLAQEELIILPLWKNKCVLALMSLEKSCDSVPVYFKRHRSGLKVIFAFFFFFCFIFEFKAAE